MAKVGSPLPSSEDGVTMKLILGMHSPDAEHKVNVRPVLDIVDNILSRATPSIDALTGTHENGLLEEKSGTEDDSTPAFGDLAHDINKVFCELTCNCSNDAVTTTMDILKTLSKYSWDAKAVLAVAAFAVNYGEFGLYAQLYFGNPLARYIGLLKQMPEIVEHGQTLKPQFDAIKTLVNAVVELTKWIEKFNDLNTKYVSPDKPPMSDFMAGIHKHVYGIIHGVVACANQIAILTGVIEGQPNQILLGKTISRSLSVAKDTYARCEEYIATQIENEEYQHVVHVFQMRKMDDILTTVFSLGYGAQTLVDSSGRKVGIENFLQKTVLILVSDIDISREEITFLGSIYKEAEKSPELDYHILWLPIVDKQETTTVSVWEKDMVTKFEEVRKQMPWYTVKDPTSIKTAVIKYIKKEWKYSGKEILVTLDSKGYVRSHNALHMFRMWGNKAFPFTDSMEDHLNKSPGLPHDLIFGVDFNISNLITEGEETICFYGGDDLEWIEHFTTVVKKVSDVFGMAIKLIYVGKKSTSSTDKVKKDMNLQKFGICLSEPLTWGFWTRLDSILISKTRLNITSNIMEMVITLLSFDSNNKGWCVLCKGSSTAKLNEEADVVLWDLLKDEEWKAQVKKTNIVVALDAHLKKSPIKHCNKFVLDVELPGDVHCYCGRNFQKSFEYRCCLD